VKYYPGHEFLEGKDQFVFSVLSSSEVIATETITIFMKQKVEDLPCPFYAMEDKVYVRSGSTISVEFLNNDRICGINDSPLQISIHFESTVR
jgi:cytochrome c oxidase assembly protein Cox11